MYALSVFATPSLAGSGQSGILSVSGFAFEGTEARESTRRSEAVRIGRLKKFISPLDFGLRRFNEKLIREGNWNSS